MLRLCGNTKSCWCLSWFAARAGRSWHLDWCWNLRRLVAFGLGFGVIVLGASSTSESDERTSTQTGPAKRANNNSSTMVAFGGSICSICSNAAVTNPRHKWTLFVSVELAGQAARISTPGIEVRATFVWHRCSGVPTHAIGYRSLSGMYRKFGITAEFERVGLEDAARFRSEVLAALPVLGKRSGNELRLRISSYAKVAILASSPPALLASSLPLFAVSS